MKNILFAVIFLSLQGCAFQSVDHIDIEIANQLCKNNQGVDKIQIYAMVSTAVYCMDGVKYSFSPIAKDLKQKNEANNLAIKKPSS
ncbi:MAG: hypothetical protein A6F71_01775 [Cycloclasticus sp. symbiont of Poecilosclerida sp. M]|nr:MAG: hypothetical protein A6F71_01775 [Cycloclasticus sp. symbiont of Poecilosclerida sp. M]